MLVSCRNDGRVKISGRDPQGTQALSGFGSARGRELRIFQKNALGIGISRGTGIRAFFAFWSTALVAIAALLVTGTILQYRWTDQASNAEEMRIGSELESLMMKWHGDLYNEFSAICVAIQVGPDFGARDTWNDYLDRYVEWNYALPHETLPSVYRNPDLVGEIYILEPNHQPQFRVVHLNLDTRKMEETSVPAELITLVARLQANSANLSMALHAWQLPGLHDDRPAQSENNPGKLQSGGDSTNGWQFDEMFRDRAPYTPSQRGQGFQQPKPGRLDHHYFGSECPSEENAA